MRPAAIVKAYERTTAVNGEADRLLDRFSEKVAFIWQIAELLRGDYKAFEYGKVVLPFVVLRRLDCVLEPTKEKVLAEAARSKLKNPDLILQKIAGQPFYNTSKLDFKKLLADPERLARNMNAYIRAYSPTAQDILDSFDFAEQIARLDKAGLLYKVVGAFADLDLHPDVVPNVEMGYIFEELIRRFSEQSNETAGEHFTPREVIRLMVNLLFVADQEFLTKPGAVRTLYDPASGTGGMLSVAEDHLRWLNPKARLVVFGQELNPESYAICKSDMMLKGQDPSHIHRGNSFTEDGEAETDFDYMLSNPPFGVDWKKVQEKIEKEHKEEGFDGRFGAGLPRINDGSFLFLQHMISKMKAPADGGSRIAIVFNGSPLFTGAAGSGESEIRRWIIENDWLDAVVALPEELFYNTGISTYVWIVTNRKTARRRGKVQLIDARAFYEKMRKSLGNKRNVLSDGHIQEITRLYADFAEGATSIIMENRRLGYQRVPIERPLRVRYEVTDATLARLSTALDGDAIEADASATGSRETRTSTAGLLQRVAQHHGQSFTDRHALEEALKTALDGDAITRATRKVVWDALTVRDSSAPITSDSKGRREADPELRAFEDVPLGEDVASYFDRNVRPHAPDAWPDTEKARVGYEIPVTRYFYRYVPPRPLQEIEREIDAVEGEIIALLRQGGH